MKKSLICILLSAIVLFTNNMIALCETTAEVPSPSIPHTIVSVAKVLLADENHEQTEEAEQQVLELTITLTEDSTFIDEQIAIIKEVIQEKTIVDYFGENVISEATKMLTDASTENLILAEIYAMDALLFTSAHDEELTENVGEGDQELIKVLPEQVEVFFSFETEYQDGTALVGLIGIAKNKEEIE